MPVETAEVIMQASRLAARFAQKTTERLARRHPSASAWEMRLAVQHGIAGVMPPLAASLHRRLGGVPQRLGKTSRSAGSPLGLPAGRRAAPIAPLSAVPNESPHSLDRPSPFPSRPDRSGPDLRSLPAAALRASLIRQGGLGETLTLGLRGTLAPHLKFDPAPARLHRGAAAAAAARELEAEAFTIGPDVFFAEGRYAPQSRPGLGLLAHELTHVGQQTALIGDKMRFFTPQGGDALEHEAQQTAAAVLRADEREKLGPAGGALSQTAAPPRPELAFALSPVQSRGAAATPAQTATEESGQPDAKADPAQADARAVADRVYDIMKQEIARGRERGASRRRR